MNQYHLTSCWQVAYVRTDTKRWFPFALHHSKATNGALRNSVGMRENAGNLRTRMAPNTDIFTQWICMMFSTFNPYKKGKKKQVSDWKEKTNFWQNIMMWMVCINIFLEFLLIFKLMFNSDDSVTLLKVERQRHQMS